MPGSFDPNWDVFGLLLAYSAAVILASIIGGLLPEWVRLTHNNMQLMISFVGGIMLGIAVFHMIPHALVAANGDADLVSMGVMLGLVATFFLLRFSHFHQHGPADFGLHAEELKQEAQNADASNAEPPTHLCTAHEHTGNDGRGTTRWVAVLVGLGLHTLMDGIALGSGVVSESGHSHHLIPGFGIFLAVLLHKPLDAVSITSLMHPVTTPSKRMVVNIGFALMCPLGAFVFWFFAGSGGAFASNLAAWGLAFSAGVFLCISLSDLLPEMEFHSHSRIPLSIALLLGIAAAWGIGYLEGEDAHAAHSTHPGQQVDAEHDHRHSNDDGHDH